MSSRFADNRFASLFSGCGGFDLGFQQSGFRACGAYDIDRAAIDNFRLNIDSGAHETDLSLGLPFGDQLRDIPALIAGPPCQGFSTAGCRRFDDRRNYLLTMTGQIARRVRPRVLVVENVAGALAGAHATYWWGLDETLRVAGYRTHTIRCHAHDVGLAQTRRRLLLFAWRTGRDARFPIPPAERRVLRDALAHVSGTANHAPQRLPRGSPEWRIAARIRPGQKLSNVRAGPNAVPTWAIPEVFGHTSPEERTVLELLRRLRRCDRQRDHGDADPVSFGRLQAALGGRFRRLVAALEFKGFVRRSGDACDLTGTFNGKFRRLSWSESSCTVDTRFGSPRYFLHPDEPRGFTVREAARIQGFPDTYRFCGDPRSQFRLIGNAVPPPLGRLAATFTAVLLGAL